MNVKTCANKVKTMPGSLDQKDSVISFQLREKLQSQPHKKSFLFKMLTNLYKSSDRLVPKEICKFKCG